MLRYEKKYSAVIILCYDMRRDFSAVIILCYDIAQIRKWNTLYFMLRYRRKSKYGTSVIAIDNLLEMFESYFGSSVIAIDNL